LLGKKLEEAKKWEKRCPTFLKNVDKKVDEPTFLKNFGLILKKNVD
jgi:hypothetical protein